VFDYLKTEQTRVKKSIGALSSVVDDELATLRAECASLRDEVQRVVDLAKSQTDSTVNLIGESRKRDTEWMSLTFSQVKETIAKLDVDVKEGRAQLYELSNSHSSSIARLGADAESNHGSLHRQIGQFSERLVSVESRCAALVAEMDSSLRQGHEELVRWSKEAREQLAALKGFESVNNLIESVHAHTSALQQRQDGVSQQLTIVSEEVARHRDAIVLMVETVDSLSRDAKAAQEESSTRLSQMNEAAEQRGRAHEKALANLSAECASLREAVRRVEQQAQGHEENLTLVKLNSTHAADWMKGMEKDMVELKQETSQASAQLRSVKVAIKDATDAVNMHKAQTRRSVDDIEKRHEAYNRAVAIFADLLKVSNPIAFSAPSGAGSLY